MLRSRILNHLGIGMAQQGSDASANNKGQECSDNARQRTGACIDGDHQTRTIVFAEDDPDDQYLIRTALQDTEYDINLVCLNDGEALMAYLEKSSPPDIILLDLNMPGTDGKALLQELKSSERYDPIPVIIYSTSNAEEDITQCYRLGANAYIVKPMRFEEIQSLVQSLCEYWFHIVKLHTS